MMASMTSSYSSELQSINGGETDSDIGTSPSLLV